MRGTVVVLAAIVVGLPSCRGPKLVPAIYQPVILKCDCAEQIGTRLTHTRLTLTPAVTNVGQTVEIFQPDGSCGPHVITLAEVNAGATFEACRNFLAADDGAIWDSVRALCMEANDVGKCVGTNSDHDFVLSGTPMSFPQKCAALCGAPTATLDSRICTPGSVSGSQCVYQVPGIPTTVTCRAARAPVVVVESCTPIDETDPVSIIAEVLPASSVTLTPSQGGASTQAQLGGFIAFTLTDCVTSPCPMTIRRIHLPVGVFSIGGDSVKDAAIGFIGSVPGSIVNGRSILVPAAALNVFARGTLASDGVAREGPLETTTPITGTIDYAAGTMTLNIQASSNALGLNANATIVTRLVNRPPLIQLAVPQAAECSSNGHAVVRVDATGTTAPDRPAEQLSYRWFIDGVPANATTAVADLLVPLGHHTISLRVEDARERVSTAERQVTVSDTAPPVIAAVIADGPTCLWPPDHKYVVLRIGQDFRGVLQDACDPSPRLTFSSAVSSQPDDGTGDGATTHDALFNSELVCLRSERTGSSSAGRSYRLAFTATDGSGNSSRQVLDVTVPRDAAGEGCATRLSGRGAETPAECSTLAPVTPASSPPVPLPPPGQGCAHVPGASVLLAFLLILRGRQRSSSDP